MSDLFDVSGKTALVTGGSRGIGFMIARGPADAVVRLVIASRKQDELEAAAKQLRDVGDVEAVPADVSTTEGAVGLANLVSDRFKPG